MPIPGAPPPQQPDDHDPDMAAAAALAGGTGQPEPNPFSLPSDDQVFRMRDEERARKKAERERMASLPIWQKGHAGPAARFARRRKHKGGGGGDKGGGGGDGGDADDEGDGVPGSASGGERRLVAAATASMSSDRRRERENMAAFVEKKREMFLVQMSLDTKREEVRKLEEKAQTKEEALKRSELMLEEDAIRFDAFLKENDKKAHDAITRAEREAKAKGRKVAEIKRLNGQIQLVQSDMSKLNETLQDCLKYKAFLDELTPPEHFEEAAAAKRARQEARRQRRIAARLEEWEGRKAAAIAAFEAQEEAEAEAARRAGKVYKRRGKGKGGNGNGNGGGGGGGGPALPPRPNAEEEEVATDSGEDVPMHFTDPSQLLDRFSALEEQNLFLIQNSQETETSLEELRARYRSTSTDMEAKREALRAQITALGAEIEAEDARAAQMRARAGGAAAAAAAAADADADGADGAAADAAGGGGSGSGQEQVLDELHAKIADVYERCGFNAESDPSSLSMLKDLESRLEELLRLIARMPNDYVVAMEKAKEKERRERVRLERKAETQKQYEERMKKSMARSMQPPKKRLGRQVMWRSRPLRKNVQLDKVEDEEDADAKFLE